MDKVRIMMKKTLIKLIILFSIVFILVSCNDAIFYIVSEEIPILKPYIDGSPTNFVEYNGKLYVASGKQIYSYSNNNWSEWKKLNNRTVALAATNASLYALYLNNDSGNGRIRNCSSDSDLSLSNVQSIHASGNVLFVCVRSDETSYTIHFRREGDPGFTRIPGTYPSFLNGVASDATHYYLCIYEGIFYVEKSLINFPDPIPVLGRSYEFTGIIELKNNYIAAIDIDGILYEINNLTLRQRTSKFSDDRQSSGALAIWYRYNTDTMPSLLLVGRRETYDSSSSKYTNGYVEISLDTNPTIKDPITDAPIPNPRYGGISGSSFREPGKGTPSSIDNNDSYVSSLGKNVVNHMIQAPNTIDSKMTLFASTHKDGVWSYRFRKVGRDENWQWNAEQ
jgi:hypothetical protein